MKTIKFTSHNFSLLVASKRIFQNQRRGLHTYLNFPKKRKNYDLKKSLKFWGDKYEAAPNQELTYLKWRQHTKFAV
jgi:hypothetical protein